MLLDAAVFVDDRFGRSDVLSLFDHFRNCAKFADVTNITADCKIQTKACYLHPTPCHKEHGIRCYGKT